MSPQLSTGAEALSYPYAVHPTPCKLVSGLSLRSGDSLAPSQGFWGQPEQLWAHSQDSCAVMAAWVPPILRDALLLFLNPLLVGVSTLLLPRSSNPVPATTGEVFVIPLMSHLP